MQKKTKRAAGKKLHTGPDSAGRFGPYGGRFVPETLMSPLAELSVAYDRAHRDRRFRARLDDLLRHYVGRPTPVTFAERLTHDAGGARIFLKREDLLHTGAHKINNALGQALLAQAMKKPRVIAETGAGQHGVATATAAALLGLECVVYMGTEDMRRQALNVERMHYLGAEVRGVDSGTRTLKDAVNEALRDWVTHVATTHYILGSVLGPDPFPRMVRDFHRVIGREARAQIQRQSGRLPALAVACVGGGSNAIGLFSAFLDDDGVRLLGVEAGGTGPRLGQHAARFQDGRGSGGDVGVLHGTQDLRPAGSRWPDRQHALGLGRARLSGGRPGTRAAARSRTRRIHPRQRRGGGRRVSSPGALRRHSAGPRERPRRGGRRRTRLQHAPLRRRAGESLRSWRQGLGSVREFGEARPGRTKGSTIT